jgi:STE24 endopeptidase
MEHVSVYAGMIFFGMLYEPLSFLLGIVMNVISRRHELEADRYAVETTSDRDHLISSLKRLHVQNLSNLTPHPFYVFLNYSHPPLLQRVEAIQAISPLSPVS